MKKTTKKFRSNAERKVSEWLTRAGLEWEFETVVLPYTSTVTSGLCELCGSTDAVVQRRKYWPDFFLPGKNIFIEVKGRLTSPDRRKMRDVKRAYPDKDIRILLLSNNKIDSRRPDRYSDWCKKNNYIYALKELPIEWFDKT